MVTIILMLAFAAGCGAELSSDKFVAVQFHAETSSSGHFNVTQCNNGQPLYDFNPGDDINVEVYLSTDSKVTGVMCMLNGEEVHPVYSVTRDGLDQHIKMKFKDFNSDELFPTLSCGINMENINTIIDCTTRFKRTECALLQPPYDGPSYWTILSQRDRNVRSDKEIVSVGSTIYYVESHVAATMTVDFTKPYIMEEISVFNNGSLSLKCDRNNDIDYRHAVIRKNKDGTVRTVGTKNNIYSFTLKEELNVLEYVCVGTHKQTSKKHEAALRVKYLSTAEPTTNNEYTNE